MMDSQTTQGETEMQTALDMNGKPVQDGDIVIDRTGKEWLFHEVSADGLVYVSYKRIFARYFHPSVFNLNVLSCMGESK
jgi:hypothetical protein